MFADKYTYVTSSFCTHTNHPAAAGCIITPSNIMHYIALSKDTAIDESSIERERERGFNWS